MVSYCIRNVNCLQLYVLEGVLASAGWREVYRPSPQRWIQEPLVVRDRDGKPQEDPLAVHCFCVCSASALLGDILGVSRSTERDLLSVLSIYPGIFLCVFIVYHRIVTILCLLYSAICWLLMCVGCFGLVVSTCQVIGYRKTPLMTPSWGEKIISTKPKWKSVFFEFLRSTLTIDSGR